jgi:capsular polysaccharide biosynthesis protein
LHDAELNRRRRTAPMSFDPGPARTEEFVEDEGQVYSVRDLLQVLARRLWVILLLAAICAGSAVGYSYLQTPIYQASIKILVGQEQNEDAPTSLGSDVMGLQQITLTMAEAVRTRPVIEEVNERLGLQGAEQALTGNLSAEQVGTTQFILVSYQDPDPRKAQRVANTVGEVFSGRVSRVSASANSITATVWEEAALPGAPVSPNPVRNGLIGLLLGAMLGVGLAFLLEQFDDRWRSPEETERISGVPTFGVIPEFKVTKSKKGGG